MVKNKVLIRKIIEQNRIEENYIDEELHNLNFSPNDLQSDG
jgi:hypothetical protein